MPTSNEPDPWRDTFAQIATLVVMASILALMIMVIYGFILRPVWEYIT